MESIQTWGLRRGASTLFQPRSAPLRSAEIDYAYDYNRDQKVNTTDLLLARNNQTSIFTALNLITVPSNSGMAEVTIVPEPSTFILLAIGAVGLVGCTWRRRKG